MDKQTVGELLPTNFRPSLPRSAGYFAEQHSQERSDLPSLILEEEQSEISITGSGDWSTSHCLSQLCFATSFFKNDCDKNVIIHLKLWFYKVANIILSFKKNE